MSVFYTKKKEFSAEVRSLNRAFTLLILLLPPPNIYLCMSGKHLIINVSTLPEAKS